LQKLEQMERNVEAILFASGDPIEIEKIADVLMIDVKTVKNLIEKIRHRYFEQRSHLDIVTLGAACQMCTLPEYAEVVRPALELRRNMALSPASLEVLAVIAYNQPVTRGFVDQVRGVDCSAIVRSLTDKGLIEEAGRLNIPGKPISYRTTANFLRTFGLEGIEQLPDLPELPPEENGDEQAEPELEGQMDFFEE
jgi:segregation and condensation protein B